MKRKETRFSYRSGVETAWGCPRAGYLEQHYLDTGIVKSPVAYWLDVGSAVHAGLAAMLQALKDTGVCAEETAEAAVNGAVEYWKNSRQKDVLTEYVYQEQTDLVQALLWAFYYHSLPAFAKAYEVLEVEVEILDKIIWKRPSYTFMSRPDAVVRDRLSGKLAVISWKTIDDVTSWRRLFFKQDLQGMTESYYAEMHRGERIDYVQTIYLVKGKRQNQHGDEAGDDAAFVEEHGGNWRQNTHLIYPYVHEETGEVAWKYRYVKPGNISQSQLKGYTKRLVSDVMPIQAWVKSLHERKVFPCPLGTEAASPLAKSIVWEYASERDEVLRREIMQQVHESERKRHASADKAKKAVRFRIFDEHLRVMRHHFPQQLSRCNFPWKCQFQDACFTPQAILDIQALKIPIGYERRTPHHDPEKEAKGGA
jgi:hypothetical protein